MVRTNKRAMVGIGVARVGAATGGVETEAVAGVEEGAAGVSVGPGTGAAAVTHRRN